MARNHNRSDRLSFYASGRIESYNNGDTRNPDRVSINPNFTGSRIIGSPNQWFNPAAFTLPTAGSPLSAAPVAGAQSIVFSGVRFAFRVSSSIHCSSRASMTLLI